MREITEAAERLRAYLDNRNPYTTYRGKPPEGAPQLRTDIQTLLAALAADAKGAGPVVVKPLEWRKSGYKKHQAGTPFGTYTVLGDDASGYGLFLPNHISASERTSTLEAAKAAAQADFDQRIRSAIVDPPAALGAGSAPEGLSEWAGWDQSRSPWGECKHKDAVLEALFRGPWSVEDAATLIGFIDRTWPVSAPAAPGEAP